ncbi:unnamed protein product [Effrenium voratum]|nr:unnamed protein product [Effrenium voratum]CAJ1434884.1 unnamed protein product [Effrenium voratum]
MVAKRQPCEVRNIVQHMNAVLDVYAARDLGSLRRRCEIEDRAGTTRQLEQCFGPKFEHFLGPEVVEVGKSADLAALAERLGVTTEPSGPMVLSLLSRAARAETTLQAAYRFAAEVWHEDPDCMTSAIAHTQETGIWILEANQIVKREVAQTSWEEVQDLFPPWKWRKSFKSLEEFFVKALGLALSAAPVEATPPAAATEPVNPSAVKLGIVERPRQCAHGPPAMLALPSAQVEPHGHGLKRPPPEPSTEAPPKHQKQNPGDSSSPLPQLPRLRGEEPTEGEGEDGKGRDRAFAIPSLPLVSQLLNEICYSNNGAEVLHGLADRREMPIANIRFTQATVGLKFSHGVLKGRRVEEVAAELAHGSLVAVDLPMVVVKFKDAYWTLNNRSLYALNLAARKGAVLTAWALPFEEMCPVTAKFVQLRCSSLMEGEDAEGPSPASEAEDEVPQFDVKEEEMLEFGSCGDAVEG